MFKKFVKELLAAGNYEDLNDVLYRKDGVDLSYQHGKINWTDHEILFELAARLKMED